MCDLLNNALDFLCLEVKEEQKFQKVTAFHRGRKMEMKESNGTWGPVEWQNFFSISSKGTYYPYPTFHLIIEYEPRIRFEGKLTHFPQLFETQFMADIQFVVKETTVAAHLAIVGAASPVMAALFEQVKFEEGVSKTIEVTDTEPEVFQHMVRYLYTGVTPKGDEFIEPLFLAADKYQIESLKDECAQYLISKLTVENVVTRLMLAHKHTAPHLQEAALDHLALHQDEVWKCPEWKDLVKNEPELFYLATQRMCAKESRKRKLEP